MDCSFRVFSNGGTLVKEEEKSQKVKEKVDKKLRKMWFGQVMSPYHSDQMSEVSGIAPLGCVLMEVLW